MSEDGGRYEMGLIFIDALLLFQKYLSPSPSEGCGVSCRVGQLALFGPAACPRSASFCPPLH